MELKIESMKNMKKAVEKCLDELMNKSDLSPSETKAALDGFRLHDELCCRIEDCENEEVYPDRDYSSRDYERPYHITSYGMPERAMNSARHHMNSMSMEHYNFYPHNMNDSYYSERTHGYSRHSISDRVVSMVERMMDSAESDYERQELQKYIRAIRAMGMAD